MKVGLIVLAAATLLFSSGCHSAYIETVVSNRTSEPLNLIEVDYPSASFGTQTLAPGRDFKYRFKVLGSGDTKLLWTDHARKDHTASGPKLNEGDEGTLIITVRADGVDWAPSFRK